MGRPPIGKRAMSGAERQRRYLDRLLGGKTDKDGNVTLKARIAELERELASERKRREAAEANAAKAAPRDNKDDRIAELEAEIRGLKLHIRFGPKRRAAEPKAEKPPLPPDEERDRQIKGLKTRVRNLTSELHHVREWTKSGADSGMTFATMSAIVKALDSDRKLSEAEREAERTIAFKAFNAWKADVSKARRKAR
jgi:hypothetical protein